MSKTYAKVHTTTILKDAIVLMHDKQQTCVLIIDHEDFLEDTAEFISVVQALKGGLHPQREFEALLLNEAMTFLDRKDVVQVEPYNALLKGLCNASLQIKSWSDLQINSGSGLQIASLSGIQNVSRSGLQVRSWSDLQINSWPGLQIKYWSGLQITSRSGFQTLASVRVISEHCSHAQPPNDLPCRLSQTLISVRVISELCSHASRLSPQCEL
ncbi:hypothetical protein ZIOFF_050008 [Zingiber officinale]|uniref:Uncharacterized protein n=1 Tax=Zingiber officinale TaxID=94328 RepID=A0A8J5FJR0_ZINOF|nr:hypothetical protein ZIOFF_050008 [Zingiber officinale]